MGKQSRYRQSKFKRVSARLPERELDIVIPVYGRPDLLGPCLAAVEANTLAIDYQLILVDDKSPEPETLEPIYNSLNGNTRLIRHTANMGFPATCNDGAAQGNAPAILFLNTDVVLRPGAIAAMLKTLWADAQSVPPAMIAPHTGQVGVVGPMLLFPEGTPYGPPGKIQHAGMDFNLSGQPIHVNIGWSADNPKVTMQRSMQAVTGACLLTRRETWQKVTHAYRQAGDPSHGGFNLVYGRGTFEDVEYCFAARSHGYRVVYEPTAVGTHHVGASSVARNEAMPLSRNASIFRARCGHLILWCEWMWM